MKYQPALFRISHWSELIKPGGYLLLLTVGLAFFPFPLWVGLLVGVLVGGSAFFRERFRWVRDTPQCVEVTTLGLTVTAKLSVPQSVAWAAVRKVTSDDELSGWRIETADRILRFGVAGLSRVAMSAIDAAIRENSMRYHFQVQDGKTGELPTAEACAQPGAAPNGGPTKPPSDLGVAEGPPSVS
jgi:hypothetical protein